MARFSLYVGPADQETMNKMAEHALAQRRSLSMMIVLAVTEYLERHAEDET